ncbi:MAG: hypothetical protein ACK55I_25135, partial [bacterium]
ALNLPEVQKKESLPTVIDHNENSDDLEIDYKEARNNLKDVIGKGKEALENLLTMAKDLDSPRAYEVVGQLIKTISDVNKDLIDIHKRNKDIRGEAAGPSTVVNNAVFIGSTADLQAIINGRKEDIIDGHTSDV